MAKSMEFASSVLLVLLMQPQETAFLDASPMKSFREIGVFVEGELDIIMEIV